MNDILNITRISVVRLKHGSDTVYLYTDLPSGVYPFEGEAYVKLELARGTAEIYIKDHFNKIPEIIEG